MGSHTKDQATLESKVAILEKQVAFLLRVNGVELSKMREASDADLLALYQDAVHMVSVVSRPLALEVIERWAEYFLQISEYELARIRHVVKFDHTWEPFYLLCIKMMTQVRHGAEVLESIRVQQLYALLEKGRKNLRDSAIMMSRKYSDTLSPQGQALLRDGDLLGHIVNARALAREKRRESREYRA